MNNATFPIVIAIASALRVGLYFLDKIRVHLSAALKGWRDIEVDWSPFGPGGFFLKQRQYRVIYVDSNSIPHEQCAITSLFTDVYWKDEPRPQR